MSRWLPAAGCVLLLAAQVPQSIAAAHMRKYEWVYYAEMARQIDSIAKDPAHAKDCALVQPVCGQTPEVRRNLTQLLSENRLNVFSQKVQQRHRYLPPLLPLPLDPLTSSSD